MSILTILFALLLSGSASFTAHSDSHSGAGPTTSMTLPGMTVDDALGGPVG